MDRKTQKRLDEILERALALRTGAQDAAQGKLPYERHQFVNDAVFSSAKNHYGLRLLPDDPDEDLPEAIRFTLEIDEQCTAKSHLFRPFRKEFVRDERGRIWTMGKYSFGSYLDIRQMQADFVTVRIGSYEQPINSRGRSRTGLLIAVRNNQYEQAVTETYVHGLGLQITAEIDDKNISRQALCLDNMERWTREQYGFPSEKLAEVFDLDSRRPRR